MSGELLLPAGLIEQLEQRALAERVEALVAAVRDGVPRMAAMADLEGCRQHAAAGLLRRSVDLLDAAGRASDEELDLVGLTLPAVRSICEAAIRGLYLLICDDSEDEFIRMCVAAKQRKEHLADRWQDLTGQALQEVATLPPWLSALVPAEAKEPRKLYQLAESIDDQREIEASDQFSAERSYMMFWNWFSESDVHATLQMLARYVREEDGVLHMVEHPEDLATQWPAATASYWVAELAHEVFDAFQLDSADISATGLAVWRHQQQHSRSD